MRMTFWWDVEFDDFFFKGFDIKSTTSLVLICILLAALAAIFEWLKLVQAKLRQKQLFLRAQQIRTICPPTESSSLLIDSVFKDHTLNITVQDRLVKCYYLKLNVIDTYKKGFILKGIISSVGSTFMVQRTSFKLCFNAHRYALQWLDDHIDLVG